MRVGFNDTGRPSAILVTQEGKLLAMAALVSHADATVVVGDIQHSSVYSIDEREVYDFIVKVAKGYADINGAQLRVPVAPKEKAAPKDDLPTKEDGDSPASAGAKIKAPKAKGKKKRTVKKRPKAASAQK